MRDDFRNFPLRLCAKHSSLDSATPYRPGAPEECLENPATVSGESVLPGFVLNMIKVW